MDIFNYLYKVAFLTILCHINENFTFNFENINETGILKVSKHTDKMFNK